MITDPSAGNPKRIYKVISFKFVVPSPNSPSTHRDAEPSHIPGQEATGVWYWPGGTWAEKHSKPQFWRGVLALPEERKANKLAACCGNQEAQLDRSHNIYPPGQVIFKSMITPSLSSPTDAAQVCTPLSLHPCPFLASCLSPAAPLVATECFQSPSPSSHPPDVTSLHCPQHRRCHCSPSKALAKMTFPKVYINFLLFAKLGVHIQKHLFKQ